VSEIINRHKNIPWHMTPLNTQVAILDIVRAYVPMEKIDLHDGTASIKGLRTDINKAAWLVLKSNKPPK
jgi:hypothetical protein